MRSETDDFKTNQGCACSDVISASLNKINSGLVVFECECTRGYFKINLTKQQAREFARQLLEICGEER